MAFAVLFLAHIQMRFFCIYQVLVKQILFKVIFLGPFCVIEKCSHFHLFLMR